MNQHDLFVTLVAIAVIVGVVMGAFFWIAEKEGGRRREEDTSLNVRIATAVGAAVLAILLETYVL